jgi:hypothetical protein
MGLIHNFSAKNKGVMPLKGKRVNKDSISGTRVIKSELIRVTSDEVNSLRPQVYKFLLP